MPAAVGGLTRMAEPDGQRKGAGMAARDAAGRTAPAAPARRYTLTERGTTVIRNEKRRAPQERGKAARTGPGGTATDSESFAGRLVVVTGASRGIGRATALAFAEEGADLALCGRNLEAVEHTAKLARRLGVNAHAWRVDVTDGPAVDAFAATVASEHAVPDIVVNNAGTGHIGTLLETSEEEWQRVLDVNLWGVIHGCRAFGSLMAERGSGGHIVNLASSAGYMPSKVLAAYATSKAAVLMLSGCLRAELAASKIGVTAICPGLINTPITRTTTFSGLDAGQEADQQRGMSRLYARRHYPPEKVATHILRAVRKNRAVVPITIEAKVGRVLARVAPSVLRAAARVKAR